MQANALKAHKIQRYPRVPVWHPFLHRGLITQRGVPALSQSVGWAVLLHSHRAPKCPKWPRAPRMMRCLFRTLGLASGLAFRSHLLCILERNGSGSEIVGLPVGTVPLRHVFFFVNGTNLSPENIPPCFRPSSRGNEGTLGKFLFDHDGSEKK